MGSEMCIRDSINTAVAEWLGGYGEGPTPDPIPNSAVKTLSADGTAS